MTATQSRGRQPVLWEYLGLHKGAENWHQRVVLQVLSALDGHIQDVDGLLSNTLQEKNKGWGQRAGPQPAPPQSCTLSAGLTLPSSSYREVQAFLKRGVSLGTLAKQEMTSSKFLGCGIEEN